MNKRQQVTLLAFGVAKSYFEADPGALNELIKLFNAGFDFNISEKDYKKIYTEVMREWHEFQKLRDTKQIAEA